jgi:hypothetical protein
MGRSCSQNGKVRNAFQILTGKPRGNIPLGGSRLRWQDNIRMALKIIAINTMNLVDSAHVGVIGEPL